MCERELETEQNCNILTPTLLAITAFLSRSPGLLNWGLGGPASLGHVPQSSILFPTHLISKLLNFLCTELYNSSTPTFFMWASQITLIQPIHSQGYIPDIPQRMHLLFTQVLSYFDCLAVSEVNIQQLLFPRFGRYVLQLSSDVCRTWEPKRNFKLCPLLNQWLGGVRLF